MRHVALYVVLFSFAVTAGVALVQASSTRDRAGELELSLALEPAELAALERDPFAEPPGENWFLQEQPDGTMLPARIVNVDLPPGSRITSVEVLSSDARAFHRDAPPITRDAGPMSMPAGGAVAGLVPAEAASPGVSGLVRGTTIASVIFNAVRYERTSGDGVIHPGARVRVRFASTTAALPRERSVTPLRAASQAGGYTGPEGTGEFFQLRPGEEPTVDGSTVDYLIITNAEMECDFQRLADWRTRNGHPAVVRRIDWINAHYPGGIDEAERIRFFIRDAYEKWGVRWVLLGGDTDVLPTRLAHINYSVEGVPERDIACDLYYAGLDGSWDGDGDGIYGEGVVSYLGAPGDSADLFPDVAVGRAPCSSAAEAKIFVDKTLRYQTTASAGYGRALFTAEVVDPFDWDARRATIRENGDRYIRDAAAEIHGRIPILYLAEASDDSILPGRQDLSLSAFRTAVNAGYGFVSMVNHGDAFKFRVASADTVLHRTNQNYMHIGDVLNLANHDTYPIFYYVNCSTSQIDDDCVNEALVLNPNGGAVAAVGPTRLAWASTGKRFMVSFYNALFSRDMNYLGDAFNYTLLGSATASLDGRVRWMTLAQVLLGDPLLPVWKSQPTAETALNPSTIALGDTTVFIVVGTGGAAPLPVEGATVTLVKRTGEYARGRTDNGGSVVLPFRPGSLGPVILTVTHPLHTAYSDTLDVVGGRAVPFVSEVTVDDDSTGASRGNGDGRADAGERVELAVTLHNNGAAALSNLGATLDTPGGHAFSASLLTDGNSVTGYVFLGAGRTHPDALPASYAFDDPELDGRPQYTRGAPDDSTGGPLEATAGNVAARWYLWQDAAGVHLRAVQDSSGAHQYSGSLTTGGGVVSVSPSGLEATDSWTAGADSIGFAFDTADNDEEDGIDIVFADSLAAVVVTTGSQNYGAIPLHAGVMKKFTVDIPAGAADRHGARFDLALTGSSGAWHDQFRILVAAPQPTFLYQDVDDATGGDGDGTPEAGETVRFTAHVLNRGSGTATALTGKLRALSGATVSDSTAAFGNVLPGAAATANDVFVASLSSDAASFSLELRSGTRSLGTTTIELPPPGAVAGVNQIPSRAAAVGGLDLGWTPSADADLAGYLVYRSTTPSGTRVLLTPRPLGRSAYYHDGTATPNTVYYYSVAALDSSGTRGPLSAPVGVVSRATETAGWPAVAEGEFWASPVMIDLNEDDSNDVELVGASKDYGVYLWNEDGSNGTPAPGYHWPLFTGGEVWSSPAVADLDTNGVLDIAVGSDDGYLFTWRADGVGLLPAHTNGTFAHPGAAGGGDIRATPAIADLDHDGRPEIIVGTTNTLTPKIYVWHADSTGFLTANGIFKSLTTGIHSSAAVANVDADSLTEIFVGTDNGKIYAFHSNGQPFIASLGDGTFATGLVSVQGSPSIADIDGDGRQELISGGDDGSVYVWETSDSLGQPSNQLLWSYDTGGAIESSPAIGDIDGDSDLEIVVSSLDRKVYAWNPDGSLVSGFPVSTNLEVWGSPILVDVDSDNRADVVVGSRDGFLYAWNGEGTLVPGWPLRTNADIYGTPAAGDLDGDGDLDIAIGSYDAMMHVFDLGVPVHPAANPWPMFRHDASRTGWYETPQVAGTARLAADLAGAPARLEQNSPNPFNPATEIRFSLAAPGPVALVIYDVGGRRVKTLIDSRLEQGSHVARWNGRDEGGSEVAAGVYFARLTAGGARVDRKMVLLR